MRQNDYELEQHFGHMLRLRLAVQVTVQSHPKTGFLFVKLANDLYRHRQPIPWHLFEYHLCKVSL